MDLFSILKELINNGYSQYKVYLDYGEEILRCRQLLITDYELILINLESSVEENVIEDLGDMFLDIVYLKDRNNSFIHVSISGRKDNIDKSYIYNKINVDQKNKKIVFSWKSDSNKETYSI